MSLQQIVFWLWFVFGIYFNWLDYHDFVIVLCIITSINTTQHYGVTDALVWGEPYSAYS